MALDPTVELGNFVDGILLDHGLCNLYGKLLMSLRNLLRPNHPDIGRPMPSYSACALAHVFCSLNYLLEALIHWVFKLVVINSAITLLFALLLHTSIASHLASTTWTSFIIHLDRSSILSSAKHSPCHLHKTSHLAMTQTKAALPHGSTSHGRR